MPANDKNSKKHGGMTREKAKDFFEANHIRFVLAQWRGAIVGRWGNAINP
jgi:hypothetical protein